MKTKHLGEKLTEDEIQGGQWVGESAQLVQMLSELRGPAGTGAFSESMLK